MTIGLKKQLIGMFAVASVFSFAQTSINLGSQAKNVDFSGSVFTKPFKTGPVLPATCSVGEAFFLTTATPGSNIYGCTALNTWTAVSSGSAQAGASVPSAFAVQRVSGTELTVDPGAFRFGAVVTPITEAGNVQILEPVTGTIRAYASPSGHIVIGHNMAEGSVVVNGAGYLVASAVSSYPAQAVPLFECGVQGGVLDQRCVDKRVLIGGNVVEAGASGALVVDCQSGDRCVVDLLGSMVATKTGNNEFLGWNRFSQLLIPSGDTLPASACDESAEHGKVFYLKTAESGKRLYACEGAAGWKLQGTPTDPANLIVKAPSADTAGAQALSSLGGGILKSSSAGVLSAAIAGVDYYRPGTQIPAADLQLTNVATLSANNVFTGTNSFGKLRMPSGDTLTASDCDEATEQGRVFYLNTATSGQKMYACEGAAGWKLQGKSVDPANLIVKAPSADMPGAQALSSLGGGILKSSAAGVVSAAVAGVDYYRPGTQIPASDLQLTNVATLSANNVFTGTNSFGKLRMPSGDTLTASDCDEAAEQGRVFYLNTGSSGQKMYACEGAAGWKLQGKSVDPTNLIVKAPSADVPGAQALSSLGGGILKSSAAGVVSAAVPGVDYYNPSTSKLPLGRLDTWDDSVIWDWDEFLSVQQSGNWKLGWYGQGTGTGYLSTTIAGEAAHPGIVRLTSGASSLNDYYSLGLIANSSAAHFAGLTTGSWFSSWQVRFLIRPGTLNNSLIRAGLMNHSGGHSPWPRITARYEHGTDSAWTLEVCSSSTSCATAATAVVPTASTWYNLVLSSPAPGTVQLSVNGGTPVCITSAATGCAQNEVAMPTSALTPVLAIGSTGTAGNRTVDLDRFDIRLEGVQQRY